MQSSVLNVALKWKQRHNRCPAVNVVHNFNLAQSFAMSAALKSDLPVKKATSKTQHHHKGTQAPKIQS
jgi:hypothetical protein